MDLKTYKINRVYSDLLIAKREGRRLLAVLVDPDKVSWPPGDRFLDSLRSSPATHIFVGGSIVHSGQIGELVKALKMLERPVVLFPGHPSQITAEADAILFLSLVSGRNPDYLIGHHIDAAPVLAKMDLEIIPTGYLLIDGGRRTAVETVSRTLPIDAYNTDIAVNTALAAQMMGNKLVYLEAGSGAKQQVPVEMVKAVSNALQVPLIVGGGITSLEAIGKTFDSGADMVVIGTAFENDTNFFKSAADD